MPNTPPPDEARLAAARQTVQTFLRRKERLTRGLFWLAALAEVGLFVLLLILMDWGDRLHWILFVGLCAVYTPLITFTWRNAVLIDRLYYRLLDDLKYGGGDPAPPVTEGADLLR